MHFLDVDLVDETCLLSEKNLFSSKNEGVNVLMSSISMENEFFDHPTPQCLDTHRIVY